MGYEDQHKALIDELRKAGIWFDYRQRIDLAWLRYNIAKVLDQEYNAQLNSIIDLIDHCVYSRIRGQEPKHEDGWYL